MSAAYDVIVVGGGGSGLAAAIEARTAGANVLLIEKNAATGGSTGWSIGSVTATGTPHQKRKGISDSAESHWRDMAGFNGDLDARDNPALRRVLADDIPDTFRWLMSHGVRFFGPMPEPPHSQPQMHNVLPNSRAFITHLTRAARRAGVSVRTGTRVSALAQDDGRVTGILCGGERIAAKSVVLAAGDFTSDPDLKARFMGPVKPGWTASTSRHRRRTETCAAVRRANRQRRSRARPRTALHPTAARQPAAPAAALAGARELDGVVARSHAERAAAAVRDELRHHRARALAGAVRGGCAARQQGRRALRRRARPTRLHGCGAAGQDRLYPARRPHGGRVRELAEFHLHRARRCLCLCFGLPAQSPRRVRAR